MIIHHHPDDSTLVSFAAGSLAPSMALLVDCHVAFCEQCQARIEEGEALGGQLLENLPSTALTQDAIDRLMARLDGVDMLPADSVEPPPPAADIEQVPPPLQPLLGTDYGAIRWHSMAPGIRQVQLAVSGGGARLLRIAPGMCMPLHSHGGSELTLVLRGSYSDEIGRFRPGDVADLDPSVEHQPIADTDRDCICLIATDAPLRFAGLVPRLLQPFFGI